MSGLRSWPLLAVVLLGACSYDFDAFDPRGASADASLGGTGGLAGSGGTGVGGAAGTGASAGGGGSAGTSGGAGGGGGSAGNAGSAGSAGNAGSAGAAGGGGSAGDAGGPVTKSYTATVADCVASINPDPDACEAAGNGGKTMSVDADDSAFATDGGPTVATMSFVRFNLDNAFSGQIVTAVVLVVTVDSGSNSNSTSSGEVWEVSAFTRPDLFNAVPSKVGSTPLAGNLGAVTLGQEVKFNLPTSSVSAGQPAFFGIFPTNTNGIDYVNLKGTAPPRLEVTYQ